MRENVIREQGRINRYISRMRVGRGSDSKCSGDWGGAGAVSSKSQLRGTGRRIDKRGAKVVSILVEATVDLV